LPESTTSEIVDNAVDTSLLIIQSNIVNVTVDLVIPKSSLAISSLISFTPDEII
jgi:hypothetical protein